MCTSLQCMGYLTPALKGRQVLKKGWLAKPPKKNNLNKCDWCDLKLINMLSISCVEKEEDTIWTELLVVTASHYEAVRCARLKKAAMIIMIQSARSRGEWVSPKKQQCARCWNLFTTNTCLTPRHGCDEQDHKRWICSTVTVKFPGYQESFQAIRKVFRLSGKIPGYQESF